MRCRTAESATVDREDLRAEATIEASGIWPTGQIDGRHAQVRPREIAARGSFREAVGPCSRRFRFMIVI